MRQFVISDIHGCARSFKALLRKLHFSLSDELYLLGDFVDRGPDSKGVFDHIFALQDSGYQVYCLKGNHEAMMLDSVESEKKFIHWLRNGGSETLQSFNARHLEEIPKRYLDFIVAMPHYLAVDNYLLVHAGFNFNLPIQHLFEDKHSMLWIRNWYKDIDKNWLGERIIVHGHTPIPMNNIRTQLEQLGSLAVLDIDGGCVFHNRIGLGNLCAFELLNRNLVFQENQDFDVNF